MAKVRSIARLDTRHTDQRLYAALKKVAEIQDQQQADDFEANIQKLAPSLRRWEKKSYQVPDDNDALHEAIPVETEVETQEVDPMDEGLSIDEEDAPPMQRQRLAEPDFDDYSNFKSGDEEGVLRKRPVPYYNYFNFGSDDEDLAPIAARKEPPKKKKKGDGLRDVVATLRKNPPGENSSKVKMRVTQVAPPIPAPKGKVKARPLCVQFFTSYPNIFADRSFYDGPYLPETTLFYHHSGPLPLAPLPLPTPPPSPPSASTATGPTKLPILPDPPHILAMVRHGPE
jgi:hypothetical protein